jgi:hypothetical protein
VAITAVASFAAGLLVASGPVEVRVVPIQTTVSTTEAPSTHRSATTGDQAQQPAEPPAGTAAAEASARATADSEASATSTSAEPEDPASDDAVDVASLLEWEGVLVVRSPAENAHVYVLGKPMGPVGKRLKVPCGLVNVRLGTKPLRSWFGPGRPVRVACRSFTEVEFRSGVPIASGAEWPAPAREQKAAPSPYWIPSSL